MLRIAGAMFRAYSIFVCLALRVINFLLKLLTLVCTFLSKRVPFLVETWYSNRFTERIEEVVANCLLLLWMRGIYIFPQSCFAFTLPIFSSYAVVG